MGEMIIGIKKELMKKGTKIKADREGIGENGEKSEERGRKIIGWRIIGVYV